MSKHPWIGVNASLRTCRDTRHVHMSCAAGAVNRGHSTAAWLAIGEPLGLLVVRAVVLSPRAAPFSGGGGRTTIEDAQKEARQGMINVGDVDAQNGGQRHREH